MTFNTNEKLFTVRNMKASDKSFIMSTFLKGLRFGSDFFREIQSDSYFKNYQKIIDQLLSYNGTEVRVACLPDDEDVILGYSIHSDDGTKAHFVFVKSAWRGIGIAKTLIPKTVTTVTHISKVGLSLIRKKGIQFDPFNLP